MSGPLPASSDKSEGHPHGPAGHATPAAAAADETPEESALVAAQTLWGRGNLSPLDHLFSATAVVNLVPKGNLGFIGRHLGHRLHRYAEDSEIWIDAIEAEPALSRIHKKKKTTIKSYSWSGDASPFKKDRYATFFVIQAGLFPAPLEAVYGQCANALKVKGKLFAGDLMWASADSRPASLSGNAGVLNEKSLHTFDEHKAAIASAGISIEQTTDMTEGFTAAIRAGILGAAKDIQEWRELGEPRKSQRKAALFAQFETWGILYALAQKRLIRAIALQGSKRQPAAS
jgi:hypothetical protein